MIVTLRVLVGLILCAAAVASLAQENFSTRPRPKIDPDEAARRWDDELGRIVRDKVNEPIVAGAKQPRLVKAVAPAYPSHIKREGISGEVEVKFLVGESGEVLEVRVENSPHEVLSQLVVTALKQWVFEPLMDGGEAKRFVARQKFVFKPEP